MDKMKQLHFKKQHNMIFNLRQSHDLAGSLEVHQNYHAAMILPMHEVAVHVCFPVRAVLTFCTSWISHSNCI